LDCLRIESFAQLKKKIELSYHHTVLTHHIAESSVRMDVPFHLDLTRAYLNLAFTGNRMNLVVNLYSSYWQTAQNSGATGVSGWFAAIRDF
jgi:hypothetical protein